MPKKTFDYICDFVDALADISDDKHIKAYQNVLQTINKSIDAQHFSEKDVEALKKHNKTTRAKYVKIFHGLYEEQSEPIMQENYDWIIQPVVIPSTRPDVFIPITDIYTASSLDSKLAILKYIYLLCISSEKDEDVKKALKETYKSLKEDDLRHHQTEVATRSNNASSENPLAEVLNHMTANMPMPEDPSKPDFGAMFGYVTHMMGDSFIQKNITALTQQLERDGMQSFFQNLQSTFEQSTPPGAHATTPTPATDNAPTEAAPADPIRAEPKQEKTD